MWPQSSVNSSFSFSDILTFKTQKVTEQIAHIQRLTTLLQFTQNQQNRDLIQTIYFMAFIIAENSKYLPWIYKFLIKTRRIIAWKSKTTTIQPTLRDWFLLREHIQYLSYI